MRAAAGEQVRSLGATFLEVDLGGIKTEDAGGYAVELSEEAMQRGRDLDCGTREDRRRGDHDRASSGTERAVVDGRSGGDGMKRGSMVIDLAGSTGGNCASARPTKLSNETA